MSAGSGPSIRPVLPMAVLAGTWVLVAVIHLSVPPPMRVHTWPLSYLILSILAFASLAWRATRARHGERVAWWLLTVSAFLEVPNLYLFFLRSLGLDAGTPGPASTALSMATGVLVLAGIMSFPRGRERRGMGRRRVLDGLLFAASILFLLWVMGVQGSLRTAAQGVGPRVLVAYLNVALLGGGLVYMTSSHPERIRGPLGWLGASALAWLGALSCWTLAGLPQVLATSSWILLAAAIPVFQGCAAWSPRPVAEDVLDGASRDRRFSRLLPYLPMAVGIVVLAVLLAFAPRFITRETFAIFLGTVVLLLLRMLQAIKDLQRARLVLEERVLARTSDLERAQDTLLRTERMNAVATLGAGLAHDLNNFLGAIRNSAELLQMDLEQGRPPRARDLTRILEASAKAGHLTRRLMDYGRKDAGQGASPAMDLAGAVSSTLEMLRMLLPGGVELAIDRDAPPCPVQMEAAALEQMLVNLVSNAKDAMPEGGKVALRLRAGALPGGGPAAVLEVSDTGPGIPPELWDAIFDPFFTTKPEGKGTGLGLASVRAMMVAQGGTIEVACPPGRGTTFSLAFPVR